MVLQFEYFFLVCQFSGLVGDEFDNPLVTQLIIANAAHIPPTMNKIVSVYKNSLLLFYYSTKS